MAVMRAVHGWIRSRERVPLKTFLERLGVFLLALLALGLPATASPMLVALVLAFLLAAIGRPCHSPRRVGTALLVAGGVFLLAPLLSPQAVVRTGAPFFPGHPESDAFYAKELPPPVFFAMGEMARRRCAAQPETCPRTLLPVVAPFSFDHAWGRRAEARFSFTGLSSLRGAFVNEGAAALWREGGGGTSRDGLPYYVALRWEKDAAGGTLCWTGTLFWEEADGRYAVMESDRMATASCRMVSEADIGLQAFGLGGVSEPALSMAFTPMRTKAFRSGFAAFLRVAGALAAVFLLTDLRSLAMAWPQALLLAAGAGLMGIHEAELLRGDYPLLPWGSSALRSESGGRMVAQALLSGDVGTFLVMDAPSFLEAPGAVLFRALERIFFGDGFGGTAALALLLLPLLFRMAKTMMDDVSAWLVVLVFLSGVLGGFGFSARLFYHVAASGASGPLAALLFLGGVVSGRQAATSLRAVSGALLLAFATWIDPVLLPAALGLLLLGGGEGSSWRSIAVYGAALMLVPLHNLVFGGAPWPSGVPALMSPVVLPPSVWWAALSGVAGTGMDSLHPLVAHVRAILFWGSGGLAPVWAALRILAAGCGFWVLVSRRPWLRPVRPVAVAGVMVVLANLFYAPDPGRFMLGGILNLLVACAVAWHVGVRPARPRYVKPPVEG